ncbi:MAG: tyrosine-type recombinase/integrase [Peptoniphilaceae bacterium]
MPAYKEKKGNWYCSFYHKDWKGNNVRKKKGGFKTKREALEWERRFLEQNEGNLDMSFGNFVEVYKKERLNRLKLNTCETKEHLIETKILPYFKNLKINEIEPIDVIRWQNELLKIRDDKGQGYSPTYLRTIHAQLSAIFNYAIKYYRLKDNPARLAGSIGKKNADEMDFWTKEEFNRFIKEVKDKPFSYEAFSILYWCGLRVGELLALTQKDFDFDKNILTINKSYQRLKGEDIITDPKTEKSNRLVYLSDILAEDIKLLFSRLYDQKEDERIFQFTKGFLYKEMDRGCKKSGVKRIRIHDLRHSHVSLLIEMGFSPVAISERVGHESIDITLKYAHMFPSKQQQMVDVLNKEALEDVQTKNTTGKIKE